MTAQRRILDSLRAVLLASLCLPSLVSAEDCILHKSGTKVCGKVVLSSASQWAGNKVTVDDSLKLSLADVDRLWYQGKTLIRVERGKTLSNFATLVKDGRLRLYDKREATQSGSRLYFGGKLRYFSIGDGVLYRLNLKNLTNEMPQSSKAHAHLEKAKNKRMASLGLRVVSALPFVIGMGMAAQGKATCLVPLGIGAACVIVPLCSLSPSMRRDLSRAIGEFNEEPMPQ
jgi:hypothetical protein